MTDLSRLTWAHSQLGDALESVARASGLSPRSAGVLSRPEGLAEDDREGTHRWVDATARTLGLEVEPIAIRGAEIDAFLASAAPAIARIPGTHPPEYLAILGSRKRELSLLGPDGSRKKIPLSKARRVLCESFEAPIVLEIEAFLAEAGIAERQRDRAREAILRERLAEIEIANAWLVRMHPGSPFVRQLKASGLWRDSQMLLAAHAAQFALWLLSWWMVGKGALEGHLDPGWLLAWGLLLLTIVPLRLLALWLQGTFAVGAGAILKQRLLYGAMRLSPEEIRGSGAGQLLGRVLESEAVESLALSGSVLGVLSILEIALASVVLLAGAGGVPHMLLLLCWTALTLLLGSRYFSRRAGWARQRLSLTNDLLEGMVGHRTRIAQETPEHWHEGEDQALERYIRTGSGMDRIAAFLLDGMPRGWLLLGLVGLLPAFAFGAAGPARLAISIGGLILAYRGLEKLAWGLWHLSDAKVAWAQSKQLFHSASRPELLGSHSFVAAPDRSGTEADGHQPILEATDLVFRYRSRGEPVLRGLSLSVRRGDRILIQGRSGGGKSTLTSLLTGLRTPESGLLLSRGLDRETLGARGWGRRVTAAPQFHENHVFNDTFAFNLLMGREWPPNQDDLIEAEGLCRELGLGRLLDRMPAGMLQMVGESGWQLSHGERSRMFLARALLQRAEVVILDESFAALDPENLEQCLRCARSRAPTLIVVAHP